MAERFCQWFLEPHDDFTNEAIARALADVGEADVSNLNFALGDDQGKIHDVWSVDHPFVAKLQKSRQPFRFTVYNRQSPTAPIRRWQFGARPKKPPRVMKGLKR